MQSVPQHSSLRVPIKTWVRSGYLFTQASNDSPSNIKVKVLSITYKAPPDLGPCYFSKLTPTASLHIHFLTILASLMFPEVLVIQYRITKHPQNWQLKTTKAMFSVGQDLTVSHSFCWSVGTSHSGFFKRLQSRYDLQPVPCYNLEDPVPR